MMKKYLICILTICSFIKAAQDAKLGLCYNELMKIAKAGDIEELQFLLAIPSYSDAWKEMRLRNNEADSDCPLSIAIENGHHAFAFILRNFHLYNNPLIKLILLGDTRRIKEAIDKHPEVNISDFLNKRVTSRNANYKDKIYCTPLTFAILTHNYYMVKYFLDNGARNIGTFITKHLAKTIPDNILDLLLEYDINLTPDFKSYPVNGNIQMMLSNLVLAEKTDLIPMILRNGAQINGFDYKGNTPLHWACTIGSPDMIALILKLGGNPNLVDHKKKRTGMQWLLRMYKESKEKNGLQIATSVLLPCLFILISNGADPEIKDGKGRTFLDWLEQKFTYEKELVYRILNLRKLSYSERISLLEDIYDFQIREMNKWRNNTINFDARDVVHTRAIAIKESKNSDFREIYKLYSIDGDLGKDPRFRFEDLIMSIINSENSLLLQNYLDANLGKSIIFNHHISHISPMMLALELNNQQTIQILDLHQNTSEKYQDQLFMHIKDCNLQLLIDFLNAHINFDIDFLHYKYIKTPLEYAVELKDINKVKILIDLGAKLDQGIHTRPLLLIAMINKDYNMIDYLIKFNNNSNLEVDGIDINFRNSDFFWPPTYSEILNTPEMRRELYRLFDAIIYKKCSMQDELSKSSIIGRNQLIERAISKGAKVNNYDSNGDTALNQACSRAKFSSIAYLIERGANVNLQDKTKGRTGLHWVIRMHKKSVQKGARYMSSSELLSCSFLLMCAGANPKIKDRSGMSVINWVEKLDISAEEKSLLQRILNISNLNKKQLRSLVIDIYDFQVQELKNYIACEKIPIPLSCGARYFWHRPECIRMKNSWVRKDSENNSDIRPDFKDIYKKYL